MSRRQEIVDILLARLKGISIDNSYQNNIAKVDEWVVSKLSDKDLPALVLRDSGSTPDNSSSGSTSYKLNIDVEVLVSDKETTMKILRTIMEDVLKSIGYEGDDLPEVRTYEGDEVLAEHHDKMYGGTRMKFAVVYDAAKWEM